MSPTAQGNDVLMGKSAYRKYCTSSGQITLPRWVSVLKAPMSWGVWDSCPNLLWSHWWRCLCILPKSSFAIHPVLNILFSSSYCPERKEWYSRERRGTPTREHKRNGICIGKTTKWAAIKALLSEKALQPDHYWLQTWFMMAAAETHNTAIYFLTALW